MMSKKARSSAMKILVYEPLPEDLYRNPGASGKKIKICTYAEMKKICYPPLCDCPNKLPPLVGRDKIKSTACRTLYMLAFASTLVVAAELGLLSPPKFTLETVDKATEKMKEIFHTRIDAPVDTNAVYERAVRPYNVKIFWNDSVVALGELLKGLGGAVTNFPSTLDKAFGREECKPK